MKYIAPNRRYRAFGAPGQLAGGCQRAAKRKLRVVRVVFGNVTSFSTKALTYVLEQVTNGISYPDPDPYYSVNNPAVKNM